MTPDEIRAAEFPRRARGYHRNDVRLELARIAELHEHGLAPARYMPQHAPYSVVPGLAYDQEAVDRYFAALAAEAPSDLQALPEIPDGRGARETLNLWRLSAAGRRYAQECRAEWRRVSEMPGARLRSTRSEVISSEGQRLLTRRRNVLRLATGQVLHIEPSLTAGSKTAMGLQVTNPESGEPVLWTRGIHFNRRAGTYVLFPGKRCLVFPVTGTWTRNAVMTAVTEEGSTALWFRAIRPGKWDAVVSPEHDVSTELLCVILLCADGVGGYFQTTSGG